MSQGRGDLWSPLPSSDRKTLDGKIGRGDEGVEEIEPVWRDIYGWSPFEWGEGVVFMRIEPTSMWAYAFHPENFPE